MFGFKVIIKGDYALFSRPEMKVERVSYDVPTPSALTGLISSVYWHPGVKYVIDRIIVYKEINFVNIRRNELNDKISPQSVTAQMKGEGDATVFCSEQRAQRASMLLKDVEYGIEFHFVLTGKRDADMTEEKCYNILLRRLKKGQHFNQPCLGCREFPAEVFLVDELPESTLSGSVDLGFMLYDLQYEKEKDGKPTDKALPRFYRPHMKDGVIDVAIYAKEFVC